MYSNKRGAGAFACLPALLLTACAQPAPGLHVAAASNLGHTLTTLSAAFTKSTGIPVIPSLGATAQLATQIENGAPFDVFLSADEQHIDTLIRNHAAQPESRAIYARGRLAVWTADKPTPASPADLTSVKIIAIAKPELAPYGAAAVEALQRLNLWPALQPRVVYASSVATAKQYADTGNADAAFTALSLVVNQPGHYFVIDAQLHQPLNQALCIPGRAPQPQQAARFTAFMKSPQAQAILKAAGYQTP